MPIPSRLASIVDALRTATHNKRIDWTHVDQAKKTVTARIGNRYVLLDKKDQSGYVLLFGNSPSLPKVVIEFTILIDDPENPNPKKPVLKDIDSFSVVEGEEAYERINDLYGMAVLIANGVFRELEGLQDDLRNLGP